LLLSFNPTALEQELFQFVNRFRTDPQGEFSRLIDRVSPISSPDPQIQQQLDYWGVSGAVLAAQWQTLTPVPPLIWNGSLYQAARAHNAAMIEFDDQRHQYPGQRMRDAGYDWRRWGENIYAYPRSVMEAHGGFVIDWGHGPAGIQDPPDHRLRLMNAAFIEIGIAVTPVSDQLSLSVGPLVVTQDLATPREAIGAHVVGAVFTASDGSRTYRPGNGLGGVRIVFEGTGGVFETTSMSAGGFQVALPSGTYRGVASGGGLTWPLVSDEFQVGAHHVALDFVDPAHRGRPPIATDDRFVVDLAHPIVLAILANDQDLDGTLDARSVEIVSGPSLGQLSVAPDSGRVTYWPPADRIGMDSFTYRVRDNQTLWSNVATASILVIDPETTPWQNPWQALDVNTDGSITPADALLVINALNAGQGGLLPPRSLEEGRFAPFVDVTGDNRLSPLDALQVINHLNRGPVGEGEWGSVSDAPPGQGIAGAGFEAATERMIGSVTESKRGFVSLPAGRLSRPGRLAVPPGSATDTTASIPNDVQPLESSALPPEQPARQRPTRLRTDRDLKRASDGMWDPDAIFRDWPDRWLAWDAD
jgi:hypothetical protein